MKRVVAVVQIFAVVCAVAFVVLLFANEPETPDGGTAATTATGEVDGAAVFRERCSTCHGADGGGGRGPQLSDGRVAAEYPDIEDQIVVVTDGRGGMPSFAGSLSEEEIRAVVEYTRTL